MQNFSKVIEKISNRHDTTRVFDDFLQMSICALTMGRMEPEYMETVRRYDKDEISLFSEAFAAMVKDYEELSDADGEWGDMLGEYFMTINSTSSAQRSGQFFTPVHLCKMMAQMVTVDEPEQDQFSVNDCSCGSSRNLIAHSRLKSENRFKTFYIGQDLDSRCIKMSVLNYFLYGMKGVIIHQNTLSMEVFGGYRVYLPETGLGIIPLTPQQCLSYLVGKKRTELNPTLEVVPEIVANETHGNGQMVLF